MIASARGKYRSSSDSSLARAITRSAMSPRTADSMEVSSRKSAISTVKRSGIEDSLGAMRRGEARRRRRRSGREPGQDRVGIGHGEAGVLPRPGR